MIDPAARRLIVASAVRLHVARCLGTGPLSGDLPERAASLGGVDDLERRYGLTFDPAYPGVTAGVEDAAGGARLVLACRADHRGEPAATVLTTLVEARPPQVTAAPPEVGIPSTWAGS